MHRELQKHRYLCIEGNIGTGKTTLAKRLAQHYRARIILEQFADNPFLPYFYENPTQYAFPVELFFLTERYKQLERILLKPDLFVSQHLSDYFFPKSLLFARINLPSNEFRLFQSLYDILQKQLPAPDMVIYLHRPVEQLLELIHRRGRSYEKHIRAEYLQEIQDAYFDYFKNIRSYPVLILDVQALDFAHREEDFELLCSYIERPYAPGVHYLSILRP